MARIIDNLLALRILWLLITPIENTEAYKLGLIDASGTRIKKAKTPEENNATSMLHRLVWNIKKFINLVPGGKTKIGSMVAAYALVRECVEQENYTPDLVQLSILSEDSDDVPDDILEMITLLVEDGVGATPATAPAPANNISGASVKEPVVKKKPPVIKRAKVADDALNKFNEGVTEYRRWISSVNPIHSLDEDTYAFLYKNPGAIAILESDSKIIAIRHNKIHLDYTASTQKQIVEHFLHHTKFEIETVCLDS